MRLAAGSHGLPNQEKDSDMRIATTTAAMALAIGTTTFAQFQINEIRTGSDPNEYLEITGTPGSSLNGVTFLIIGDGTSTGASPTFTGVVEWKWTFTKSDVIGPNGFLVLHNPLMSAFTVDPGATAIPWIVGDPPSTTTGFEASDNQTYMLVSDYSGTDTFVGRAPNQGAGGQDLDTNDDGVLDVTPWTAIIDSVAVKETLNSTPPAGQDWWYSLNTAGPYVSRTLVTATSGDVIAGWDFQTTTNPNGGTAAAASPNTPNFYNSNTGFGTMHLNGTEGSSNWTSTQLAAFTGTGINATGTGDGGNGLDPSTNTTSSLALVGSPSNGQSVVFKFSMTNYLGLNVTYATRTSGTTTGFNSQQWAWSTDGHSWTNIDVFNGFTTSFALKTLAPLASLNGAADAYLRLTFDGATTTTSNNRLDNILFFSNPVTTDTVVTNYGAPVHVFKTAASKAATAQWNVGPGSTTGSWDTPGLGNYVVPALSCGSELAELCDAEHFNPYCSDSCCCDYVCQSDPYCCQVHWDSICVTKAGECSTACAGGECPADFNLDMIVDGADLGTLLGSWGTPDNDLTGDGLVDGADLGQLLGAWGPCN